MPKAETTQFQAQKSRPDSREKGEGGRVKAVTGAVRMHDTH